MMIIQIIITHHLNTIYKVNNLHDHFKECDFCPDQVREELENKSGLVRMKTDKNFANPEEAGKWYRSMHAGRDTISQSADGDLLLSIK